MAKGHPQPPSASTVCWAALYPICYLYLAMMSLQPEISSRVQRWRSWLRDHLIFRLIVVILAVGAGASCGRRAVTASEVHRHAGPGDAQAGAMVSWPAGTFEDNPLGEAAGFAVCSRPAPTRTVDFRPKYWCMELYGRLTHCCSTIGLLKTYVFQILIPGCDQPAPGEDDCRRIIAEPGRLDAECQYLQTLPTCNSAPMTCFGGDAGTQPGGCYFDWKCKDAPGGKFRLTCSTSSQGSRCKCERGDGSTSSFSRPDNVCLAPSFGVQFFRANEHCGWKLPTHKY